MTTHKNTNKSEPAQPHSFVSIRHDPYPVDGPFGGIYAYGVETKANARILYISGQVGEPPEGNLSLNFKDQCRQAIWNVEKVLHEADMTLKDIVKMSFFLTRPADMQSLLEVRKELVDGVRPAITTLFVAGLMKPEWLIEVEVIASAE